MSEKNRLTCTNERCTTVRTTTGDAVDSTAKKIISKMRELEQIRWKAEREINALRKALEVAGVRPEGTWELDLNESEYAEKLPFQDMSLVEACEKILHDHPGKWLSKSEVEYLIARGGYKSSANDPKNSVNVTLRRLTLEGKCAAERKRGLHGNRYCLPVEAKKEAERRA